MVNNGTVYGSKEQAVERIIDKDTVYIHSNIKQLEKDRNGEPVNDLYQYEEIQYTKDEYINLLTEKSDKLENDVTSNQIALCELYELLS